MEIKTMVKQLLVAQIVNNKTLILNKGSREGIQKGQEYIVYKLGDRIIDPETHEDLGQWEIVRGRGEIVVVEEKYSVLESRNWVIGLMAFSLVASGKNRYAPFDSPEVCDIAKLIEVKKEVSS